MMMHAKANKLASVKWEKKKKEGLAFKTTQFGQKTKGKFMRRMDLVKLISFAIER